MECEYCGADLEDEGAYGYLAQHQSGEVLGRIYRCPNYDGFETKEEAYEYLSETEQTLESLGLSSWETLTCEIGVHSFYGTFHTDSNGNLHNGYPC